MSEQSVVLVDDHQLLIHTLVPALVGAGLPCTAVTPRPTAALVQTIVAANPTVALVDLNLTPFGDGADVIAPLTAAGIRVVVLTAEADRIRLAEALEQGAVRVVSKAGAFDDLVAVVRETAAFDGVRRDPQAGALLAELAAHRRRAAADRAPFDRLTEREQETLAALARGRTVQQISAHWVVAETTVRSHVRAILHKLGTRSQLQAVVRAVHAGWIDPDADEFGAIGQFDAQSQHAS